jgi:protein-S-isoprenylcysteine O-methyltransferase Ste14
MPQSKTSSAPAATGAHPGTEGQTMLPHRRKRRSLVESFFVRIIATCGVVAIGVAIAAIMTSSKSEGWLIGLVVSIVSVVLAAVLWSSRRL